jgi:hypothetical protein
MQPFQRIGHLRPQLIRAPDKLAACAVRLGRGLPPHLGRRVFRALRQIAHLGLRSRFNIRLRDQLLRARRGQPNPGHRSKTRRCTPSSVAGARARRSRPGSPKPRRAAHGARSAAKAARAAPATTGASRTWSSGPGRSVSGGRSTMTKAELIKALGTTEAGRQARPGTDHLTGRWSCPAGCRGERRAAQPGRGRPRPPRPLSAHRG